MKNDIIFDIEQYEEKKYDVVMPLEKFQLLIDHGLNQNIEIFIQIEKEINKIIENDKDEETISA